MTPNHKELLPDGTPRYVSLKKDKEFRKICFDLLKGLHKMQLLSLKLRFESQ